MRALLCSQPYLPGFSTQKCRNQVYLLLLEFACNTLPWFVVRGFVTPGNSTTFQLNWNTRSASRRCSHDIYVVQRVLSVGDVQVTGVRLLSRATSTQKDLNPFIFRLTTMVAVIVQSQFGGT
jgi:hypothetical protein